MDKKYWACPGMRASWEKYWTWVASLSFTHTPNWLHRSDVSDAVGRFQDLCNWAGDLGDWQHCHGPPAAPETEPNAHFAPLNTNTSKAEKIAESFHWNRIVCFLDTLQPNLEQKDRSKTLKGSESERKHETNRSSVCIWSLFTQIWFQLDLDEPNAAHADIGQQGPRGRGRVELEGREKKQKTKA